MQVTTRGVLDFDSRLLGDIAVFTMHEVVNEKDVLDPALTDLLWMGPEEIRPGNHYWKIGKLHILWSEPKVRRALAAQHKARSIANRERDRVALEAESSEQLG